MVKPWSMQEDIFILKNKDELDKYEIAIILDRSQQMINKRLAKLAKSNRTIENLEYEEKYIIDNHKTLTRSEMAEVLKVGPPVLTFRLMALEREGKLRSRDVPKKEYYQPKAEINLTKRADLDKPVDSMPKTIRYTIDENEGARLDKLKLDMNKTYEVSVDSLRDNSTRYINYFKGKLVYQNPYFFVLQNKHYAQSFLKVNIATGDTSIKEL